jgi:hypothetical protein
LRTAVWTDDARDTRPAYFVFGCNVQRLVVEQVTGMTGSTDGTLLCDGASAFWPGETARAFSTAALSCPWRVSVLANAWHCSALMAERVLALKEATVFASSLDMGRFLLFIPQNYPAVILPLEGDRIAC